jgi:hypothetical protein
MSLFISAEFCTWISTRPKALHKSTCCSSFCSQCCVHGSMFPFSWVFTLYICTSFCITKLSLRTAYGNIFSEIFYFLLTAWRECSCRLLEEPRTPSKRQGRFQGVKDYDWASNGYLMFNFNWVESRCKFIVCVCWFSWSILVVLSVMYYFVFHTSCFAAKQ